MTPAEAHALPGRRLAIAGTALIVLLHVAWSLQLPPQAVPVWLDAAAAALPALPALALWLARRPSAGFWAGVAALFYFMHGVMEAWSTPEARAFAVAEALLAVGVVLASSLDAMRARAAARRAARAGAGDASPPAAG